MKNSLETKLGIFVILAIFAAFLIVETLGGIAMFKGGYHVSALFDTAQDLKPGDSVRMAGVKIGSVETITLADQKVKIIMKVDKDAVVKTDSKATIKFTGLMGQNYVAISFGSAGGDKAMDGTVLEAENQPDLNSIMAKLDNAAAGVENLTKSFTPDTINNLMGPLVDLVKQNSDNISGSISNINNITAQIASGQGTVGKLIYDQSLYNSAIDTVSNLQHTVAAAQQVINNVTNGQGTLGKLVTDDTLYTATTASMTNLSQILVKINQGQGTVGKLVNDQEFYKNAKLSLQKLDKAADSLEDTGPLSVIGTMVNTLF